MFTDNLRIIPALVLLVALVILLHPVEARAAINTQREGILWTLPGGIKPDMTLTHPRILYTQEDVARARVNVSSGSWGRAFADTLVRNARNFSLTDDEIREMMPPQDAYYLYLDHYMLCPDGSRMLWAGLSNPGKCLCNGQLMPDAEHPDDGTGWKDGKGNTYYFVARWNGAYVEYLSGVLDQLAQAYALTADPEFAHKAAVILDALATIYPTATEGPLDYPGLRPGFEGGRLERPYYQTARVLLRYANAVDLIWESGELDQQSVTNPALSVRDNIVYNMLINGADYCYREVQKPGYIDQLHNGTADYNKAILAVGSLLGIDTYVEWGVNGPTSLEFMLANNINRDGLYFETTTLYTDVVRTLYIEIAELLYKLRTPKYPSGVNMFDNARFAALYTSREAMFVAGRNPLYGDSDADNATTIKKPYDEAAARYFARLAVRVTDPQQQQEYWQRVADAVEVPVLALANFWGVMNVTDAPAMRSSKSDLSRPSEVVGGSGFVIMRAGQDRGVVLRYGPTLNHGQYDELALLLYANGREMSFDPGYGDAHYRTGFLHQTVAHLTTVVNRQRQLDKESAGGSLEFFSTSPGMTLTSACDEDAYDHLGVDHYCRTLAYADTSPTQSYLVDIFRVQGGNMRDYSFHSRGSNFQTFGLDMGPEQPGSVASSRYTWHNQIGQDLRIIPHRNEAYSWNAPPENGYGFLGFPATGQTEDTWSASWAGDIAKLRLTMLPAAGREVIVAQAPSPMGDTKYVLARDRGNQSQYVAVIDAGVDFQVTNIVNLDVVASASTSFAPVAFSVDLIEPKLAAAPTDVSVQDVYLSSLDGEFTASSARGEFVTDAEIAMVRLAGDQPIAFHLAKGTQLSANDWTITGVPAAIKGKVIAVDYVEGSILVSSSDLLADDICGEYVLVSHERYNHTSPYRILEVSGEGDLYRIQFAPNSFELAMGVVSRKPSGQELPNMTNLPYSRNVSRGGATTYYNGKLVMNQSGVQTFIQQVKSDFAGLIVDDTSGFAEGDRLTILDVKPGDEITIPTGVHLIKVDPYTYELKSNQPIKLAVPQSYAQQVYVAGTGAEFTAAKQELVDGIVWYSIPPGAVKIGSFAVLDTGSSFVVDAGAPQANDIAVRLTVLGSQLPVQNAVVTVTLDGNALLLAEKAPGRYGAQLPENTQIGKHQLSIEATHPDYIIQPLACTMDVQADWSLEAPAYFEVPLGSNVTVQAQIKPASASILDYVTLTAQMGDTSMPMVGDGQGNYTATLPVDRSQEAVTIKAKNQNGFVKMVHTRITFTGGEILVPETQIRVPVNGQVSVSARFISADGTVLKGTDIPEADLIYGFLSIFRFEDEDGDGVANALVTAPRRAGEYPAYIEAAGCETVTLTLIVTE